MKMKPGKVRVYAQVALGALILAACLFVFKRFVGRSFYGDELVHFLQIALFYSPAKLLLILDSLRAQFHNEAWLIDIVEAPRLLKELLDNSKNTISLFHHRFILNPGLTNIPGYHALIAAIAALFSVIDLAGFRTVSFCVSSLAIPSFAVCAMHIDRRWWKVATLQFIFLPILFLFFFLLYPDALSTGLCILTLYLSITNRLSLSAVVGLLSVLVRQPNILWVAFSAVLYHLTYQGWSLSRENIIISLRKLWPHILVGIGFIVFVILNHGVALSDKDAHPLSVHTGNIFFALFVAAIIFLPLHVANAVKVWRLVVDKKWLWVLLPVLYMFFLLTFNHSHPYNNYEIDLFGMRNLRNTLLIYACSTTLMKTAFFVICAYCMLSLMVTPLLKPEYQLIYPASAFFLSMSWLIEQRYYMVPMALFLLVRKRESEKIEWSILAMFVLCTALLLYGVESGRFDY